MNINATIKKQYLDMKLNGAKTTEYRDMSTYWTERIVETSRYKGKTTQEIIDGLQQGSLALYTKPISQITFMCNKQRATYQVLGISVYQGYKFYAIRLGKQLSTNTIKDDNKEE